MNVKNRMHEEALSGARWFAGKGREISRTAEADSVPLPGGAERLVLLDVEYSGGQAERYLVADAGGREPKVGAGFWARLIAALARGPLQGERGRLELRPARGLPAVGPAAQEGLPSTDQSNTLVSLGGQVLLKAYRRLEAGTHPEIELCSRLAAGAAPVPAFHGSVHHRGPDGSDTAIALLQELVPGCEAGWDGPIVRAADLLARPGDPGATDAEYAAAGRAAAELHAALAAAFETSAVPPGDWAARRAAAERRLAEAAALDAEAAGLAGPVREGLALLEVHGAGAISRVHGDLHYAQYLRAPGRLLIIDFEGDPTLPLAARRAPDTPLHDLACLLRSIDHIGSAAARRTGADPAGWIRTARAAALGAYAVEAGARPDPELLWALELAKACQELVYAHRVVPEWAYAPRQGLRRLIAEGPGGP